MKNVQNHDSKHRFAVVIGNMIEEISELLVMIPCHGPWYEPKVPESLKKE